MCVKMRWDEEVSVYRTVSHLLIFVALICLSATAWGEDSTCVTCHKQSTPVIVTQWMESKHSKKQVDCSACHVVKEAIPGAREHFGGVLVTPAVSPKVCGSCHANEEKQFTASRHSHATEFIGSLDNIIGEVIEGGPAANQGCRQCHGSELKVSAAGTLTPETWPNSGIGRVNTDGTKGACSSCHARHEFSIAQVREPEICGKCHLGPDHPHIEIFNESKHGILYNANKAKMNLDAQPWVVGITYSAAPNCATCHVSATPNQTVTHDVGARISWTLRPAISSKLENWESRRESMQGVCRQCHSPAYVETFYKQYEASLGLYNDKFAKPAKDIIDQLHAEKLLTESPFDEKLEWTYYSLWHHEGRRARHGAAMMGPDYTQWHGFFELADNFYNEFLPAVKELKPELVDEVLSKDEHKWKKGISKEDREKTLEFYKDRYGQ
jgi:hydroxylamine dehydrogenase